MCDFSLHAEKNRPAVVGDKLITHRFNIHSGGFRSLAPADNVKPPFWQRFWNAERWQPCAVCLKPGTEIVFDEALWMLDDAGERKYLSREAVFRKVNEQWQGYHHDALEFTDGTFVLLNAIEPGYKATVLQLSVDKYFASEPEALASGVMGWDALPSARVDAVQYTLDEMDARLDRIADQMEADLREMQRR